MGKMRRGEEALPLSTRAAQPRQLAAWSCILASGFFTTRSARSFHVKPKLRLLRRTEEERLKPHHITMLFPERSRS
jgi:hypothetical protein